MKLRASQVNPLKWVEKENSWDNLEKRNRFSAVHFSGLFVVARN